MYLEFQATEGGFEGDDDRRIADCLACGVSGPDQHGETHYFSFQRSFASEDPSEDRGIHVEFDDQINSGYNRVAACRISRTQFVVDFTTPFGRPQPRSGVRVDLSGLDDESYRAIVEGLPQIFREKLDLLTQD